MAAQLIITVAVPGAGKTTHITGTDLPVVHPDSIRVELTGTMDDQSRNTEVFALAFARLAEHLAAGRSVIFDATNVDPGRRRDLYHLAVTHDAEPVAWRFAVAHDIARARNAMRDRVVPTEVMDRMIAQFDGTCRPEQLTAEGWTVVHIND